MTRAEFDIAYRAVRSANPARVTSEDPGDQFAAVSWAAGVARENPEAARAFRDSCLPDPLIEARNVRVSTITTHTILF